MADPKFGLSLDSRARSIEGTRKIVQDRMWQKEAVDMEQQLQKQIGAIDSNLEQASREIIGKVQKLQDPAEAQPFIQQAIQLQNDRFDQVMNIVAKAASAYGKNPHARPALDRSFQDAQQRHQAVMGAVLDGQQQMNAARYSDRENPEPQGSGRYMDRENPEPQGSGRYMDRENPEPQGSGRYMDRENPEPQGSGRYGDDGPIQPAGTPGKMQTETGEFAGESVSEEEMRRRGREEDEAANQYLMDKFGEDFVLPKDRDDNQIVEDVANLMALGRAEPGKESSEFSKEVLGGLAYDYELELEALQVEAAKRGMDLTDADDEAQDRIDEWRRKKKKFEEPKDTEGAK